jgi:hypothetical protein
MRSASLLSSSIVVVGQVHLGNYPDQESAGYAVSMAKTRLRTHGFTVKLQDNEVEPVRRGGTRLRLRGGAWA